MDKFDKHRGGDRHSSISEDPHHYNSSNRHPRSGSDVPDYQYRQENYRGGGVGRVSPNYRSGLSSSSVGDVREHRRPFDSPPSYPPPPSGGDGGFGGGLRPIGDGVGGFRPMVGGGSGGGGFRSMGSSGRGFGPMGGDVGGEFRPMGGGGVDGEKFRPMGGGERFQPMGGGERFQPMGGGGVDGERFQPMGGGGVDGEKFRPMGGGERFQPIGGGERFQPMGGGERFQPMAGGGVDGERFLPMGGGGVDGERFRPMSGGGVDGERFRPMGGGGGGDGERFRPMGGGGGDGEGPGLDNSGVVPVSITGQKRGYSFFGRERSPDRSDGGSFAKLFVGSVPRTATEDDIRPLFDKHGRVLEVALIKDKRTGQQQGCCFIKYVSSEEADRAIRALHNQYTLPGGGGPIQVRYADGERERLGATEYKLFVGSLNKQANEKEVEEIFQPYGRVEDVYLMRDEMKQSRGCGFVKYSQREMAQAAINALNGAYTMRGCDQPLTVRFADPKRPRPGESRGPAFGGLGFGPRFSAPGIRPAPDLGEPHHGHIPPNSWRPVSPRNTGPPSNVGIHGFGNQLPARSGDSAVSSTPVPIAGLPGNADGPLPGRTVSSAMSQLNFSQPFPQIPSFGSQISPVQRPLQSPQHLSSSLQLQPPNVASFTNTNSLQGSHMQLGPMQMSHSAGQTPMSQVPPSRQLPGLNGQLHVPHPQLQHNASLAPGQAPGLANKQQLPSQQLQPLHQSPSQLAQMLSQQKQTLQATFQSSQQAFNQLQQQVQQLQPSNQNLTSHQGPQATKQQSPWGGIASQPVANTPGVQQAGDAAPTTTASLAGPAVTPAMATGNINWTEHTSPDGYKYYYNSSTGESKWEKPEELTQYELPQQHQKPYSQHSQVHSHPQGPSTQQAPQMQVQLQGQHQAQLQNQIQPLQQTSQSSPYQVHGLSAKQSTKELGYSQIPGGTGPANDPARYQQRFQASQEWMWKNKPSGT